MPVTGSYDKTTGRYMSSIRIRNIMAESVSLQAEKLFKAMKQAGAISEEKMLSAEKATTLSKLPKAQCMNALQELEKKGLVKKKSKNNAVAYFLAKTDL